MVKKKTTSLILVFLCLLGEISCTEWQGTGSNVSDYLPLIWANIQDNIGSFVTVGSTNHTDFAKFLSDAYNKAWDPAWNVIVTEVDSLELDAILIGYAFRDHWLWYNGYKYNSRIFGFVIWKDYNCKTWHSVDNSNFKSVHPTNANFQLYVAYVGGYGAASAKSGFPKDPYTDLWTTTFMTIAEMQAKNPTKAYSIVVLQASIITHKTSIGSRICSDGAGESFLVDFASFNRFGSYYYASQIIIEMRSS